MQNNRSQYYESFLTLSETVGITINDVTRFGTSLMRSENIHSYDFAGDQKTASLYLTFFSLHLPYTFINDKWPDEPFQFLTLLESNISNAKLITSEVSNILNLFERKIAEDIPIQYITNENWYVNRNKFYIDKNVNLPYSYHAGMFENLLGQQQWNNFQVLDMGTGSGCIGISLALLIPRLKVDLVDISSEALSVAQKNIDMYNLNDRVRCIQSDLFSEVENKYDMIITNPPWVGTDVPLSADAKHQPRIALESGEDGMDHINKILSTATEYLNDENSSLIITEIPMKQFDLIKQHYPNISFEEFNPVNYDGSICKTYINGSRLLKTKKYITI